MASWTVLNESSFATVQVKLPPLTGIDTESDAVVTMSDQIDVQGRLTGGIFGALSRMFLTRESFFTTRVENRSREQTGDVLLAASTPGGIFLHSLDRGQDLLLTKGSYMASDCSVLVTTEVQSNRIENSLWSGTGFFLLRAKTNQVSTTDGSKNVVALASYGAIHKYTLGPGERRIIDNGHILAWSATMSYRTTLASSSVWGSLSSGEGLMCAFVGPGTVYLQSHKPNNEMGGGGGEGNSVSASRNRQPGIWGTVCFGAVLVIVVFLVLWLPFLGDALSNIAQDISSSSRNGGNYHYDNNYQYRQERNNYEYKREF